MFKIFAYLKLRTKLILSYLFIILFILLCSNYILSNLALQNIKMNTLSYINLFCNQLSSNIDTFIGEIDRLTKTTFLDKELCSFLEEDINLSPADSFINSSYINNHILRLITNQPHITNVLLVSNSGKIYTAYTFKTIKAPSVLLNSSWINEIEAANGRLVISQAHTQDYFYSTPKNIVFSIGRMIKNSEGKTVGKIILDIDSTVFTNLFPPAHELTENQMRIAILSKEGKIIFDSLEFKENELPLDIIGRTTSFYETFRNSKRFFNFSHTSDYSLLNTVVVVSNKNLYYSVNIFKHMSLVITLICFFITLLFAFYFSYCIVEPIKKLEIITNRIHEGNFDIQSHIISHDEIGSLAKSFDTMTLKIKELIHNVLMADITNKQSELNALQNQINPHFLLNTLESIRMKAVLNKDPEVATMIKHLGKLFRITLNRKNTLTTLKDELEHITSYLNIQNMRYDNQFKFTADISKELLSSSIIKLILQPLVENCIIHGFKNQQSEYSIQLFAYEEDNALYIIVKDNGIGIPKDRLSEIKTHLAHKVSAKEMNSYKSIGILNISDRIRLEYGSDYYLTLDSEYGKGTIVTLKIPKI